MCSDAELSIWQSVLTPRAFLRNQAISPQQKMFSIPPAPYFSLQYFRMNLVGAGCHHQYAAMLINIAFLFSERFSGFGWLLTL